MNPDEAAARLHTELAIDLRQKGVLDDPAWRRAFEAVPRHRFVPGFYDDGGLRDEYGLFTWQPVTEATDRDRWLAGVYADQTLITQFDAIEPDWDKPEPRVGGAPTSSSTLPWLVMRMWADADIEDGHDVLEIGTGTGYSTALACERLGAEHVTSVDVDSRRLDQAAATLFDLEYFPTVATADGLYGYWPAAPYDRVVAACSVRAIPRQWLAQTRPGGKILATLSGWLHGYARALLTVGFDGTAGGPLLPGTISFMPARAHEAPRIGDPARWAELAGSPSRATRHAPERITAANDEAFFARFLVQCAIPDAQLHEQDDTTRLIDAVSGSVAVLTRGNQGGWLVREGGPRSLWQTAEAVLDAYDDAGRPSQEEFRLDIDADSHRVRHPRMPELRMST
jgi:methyltransferase of ATP-grasp peptide maturase system